MFTPTDEAHLRFALRLATAGRGNVEPNPMVACVLVLNDKIIGQGYHAHYGQAHAEPTALATCQISPVGATAYVTLEPCCHRNKKTPPCAPRLIEAGIKRVVIGCLDPNPSVNGQGVAMLREAGIEVVVAPDELHQQAKQLIAPFILRTLYERAYVTMKWAQTQDRKIAGHESVRLQITGEPAQLAVHTLRSRSDAIIVGINTVLNDDPSLTVRGVTDPARTPERIVLDHKLRTPPGSELVRTAIMTPTVVVTSLTAPSHNFDALVNQGVRVVWPPAERDDLLTAAVSAGEYVKKVYTHVLIEPGPTLARSVFRAGLCDRLWVFESTRVLDDASAPTASDIPQWFVKSGQVRVGDDTLCEYLNTQSPGFFVNVPSVDFELLAVTSSREKSIS